MTVDTKLYNLLYVVYYYLFTLEGVDLECMMGGAKQLKKLSMDGEFYGRLMSCQEQHFLVIIRKIDVGILLCEYEYSGTVQLIGPPEEAQRFTYRYF
jgi:hypothetical protein